MNVVQDSRYPVTVGQREEFIFSGIGPKSYSQTTSDPINLPSGIYLDYIGPCTTVSKNYELRFFPSAAASGARPTWVAKWYTIASSEVTGNTDLSAEKVQFWAIGGNF